MSELINNATQRKVILKELILKLHDGSDPDVVRKDLEHALTDIPYADVVEVEQQLMEEGMSPQEIQRLCDIHSYVLRGKIDLSGMMLVPPGHPIDTFKQENKEIRKICDEIEKHLKIISNSVEFDYTASIYFLKFRFNLLADIDKHYKRKENLLFPFLEKLGITAPPKVMWGKHDEIREISKATRESLSIVSNPEELISIITPLLIPTIYAIKDMIIKEEEILLPMCSDKLTEKDWYEVYVQTSEYGYCLYDPKIEWKPKDFEVQEQFVEENGEYLSFPTGKLNKSELLNILNTLPFDLTFVDKDDRVKYFSDGKERVFERSRAVLLRDVRLCHPPSSVHIVDKIIEDFKSGREDRAPFWINMHGKFIHIEYFAVRDEKGEYLGTLEVSKDLTEWRNLQGEQRLLNYTK